MKGISKSKLVKFKKKKDKNNKKIAKKAKQMREELLKRTLI